MDRGSALTSFQAVTSADEPQALQYLEVDRLRRYLYQRLPAGHLLKKPSRRPRTGNWKRQLTCSSQIHNQPSRPRQSLVRMDLLGRFQKGLQAGLLLGLQDRAG